MQIGQVGKVTFDRQLFFSLALLQDIEFDYVLPCNDQSDYIVITVNPLTVAQTLIELPYVYDFLVQVDKGKQNIISLR